MRSARAGNPFMEINCAAIPESLMTAELFGHEKGAFTGAAVGGRIGLLEAGDGGTVFLDEIGDMPLSMQATLLRVIETREVRPVGGRPLAVDRRALHRRDEQGSRGHGQRGNVQARPPASDQHDDPGRAAAARARRGNRGARAQIRR